MTCLNNISLNETPTEKFFNDIYYLIETGNDNICINENTELFDKYKILLETSVNISNDLKAIESLDDINNKSDNEKNNILKNISNKVSNIIKWWMSEDPTERYSTLRFVTKIFIKILSVIIKTFIINKAAETIMMKSALKITYIIISFIVSTILTFIEGIILKKIIIPSKIEPNKELITVETITNLRNQSMLLREEYDRYASSLSFGSRSKLLITIQKYDSAISKLVTIRKRKEVIDSANIAKKSDKYEIGR